jgi:hypothetical protein
VERGWNRNSGSVEEWIAGQEGFHKQCRFIGAAKKREPKGGVCANSLTQISLIR